VGCEASIPRGHGDVAGLAVFAQNCNSYVAIEKGTEVPPLLPFPCASDLAAACHESERAEASQGHRVAFCFRNCGDGAG
jgi:hypothetical protein